MKKKNKGGRPKEIDGETTRVSYYLTVVQANFVIMEAEKQGVSESEIVRGLIDYMRANAESMKKSS